MASLRVLAFDHEGRPVQFDTWLDDLQLYLLSDSKDSVSLFDLVSGAATALPATANSLTRSQWLTRDAAARLAIHNHLPLTECAHLRQHRTAQALYDAVVARYSSPATAALGRLLLPYLFPELSAFATVGDLVSHLCASDARYRATAPVEFFDRNQPPMFITLYLVTRLPDSLRSVREHFLSLDPTSLTVHLLEQNLLAAETSAVAVGAACGTPRPPFFEGCSPSPLAPSYASAAAADVSVAEDVGATSASAKRCSSKGKGSRGGGGCSGSGGGGSGSGGGGSSGGGGGSGDGGGGGTVGRSGGSGGSGGGSGGSGGSGGGGNGSGGTGARRVGSGGGQRQQQQRRSKTPSPQQLREWFLRGASRGSCPYVISTGDHAGQTCRIAIFDLDFDAILSAMYALSVSVEGDCYWCVPPDSGIAAAALKASESGTLPGISPAEALHTLDSGASCCFFCDSTTLTPLPAHVPVRRADPSRGPVVARSSTVLPCPAVPSGSLSGLHLPSFSTNLVSTAALQDAMVTTTTPGGVGAVARRAGGPRDNVRPRPYFVPLPQQPASPLPAPSPYTKHSGGLTERREPASRLVSPLRTARRIPRSRPPSIPGTHAMTLRPSSVPLRVPLPAPLESSIPEVPDPESDRARAASPTVSRLLATAITDPSFESAVASALVAELLDFAAACRLDYASALVAESASASPPSVGGECALGTDVLEDMKEDFESLAATVPRFASMLLAPEGDPDAPDIPTPRSYTEAITGPYSSQWQAAMDAEMAFWKSIGTYVKDVPPPGANIVDGMWIFRVKRPPGSPPAFKARYVARGFSQRQGVDYFQTFSPTPKMTTLRVLLHVAAQCDYELHSLDFSTAFLQGSLHDEIWLRCPPGLTKSFPAGTRWTLRRQVYGLRQAAREWHDTLRTTLAALGFAPATADPLLFLRTDTSLPPFYVLVYVDDLVFATIHTKELTLVKSELQKRHTCYLGLQITRDRARRTITLTQSHMVHQVHWDAAKRVPHYLCSTSGMGLVLGGRGPVVLTGHADASWVDDSATQRSSQGYTFSLGSGSVSWRSTRSSSVLSSSCEAEIYAGAMAAQKLRWLTYLLTDLGEQPRSPPVLYVDNKAMIALFQEHRLEHRTKHIALRYFLARELQQRGQVRLAYVATQANTADVFTKALLLESGTENE
ncbi:unnamed protein product [Closterium sp. NIES-54]